MLLNEAITFACDVVSSIAQSEFSGACDNSGSAGGPSSVVSGTGASSTAETNRCLRYENVLSVVRPRPHCLQSVAAGVTPAVDGGRKPWRSER